MVINASAHSFTHCGLNTPALVRTTSGGPGFLIPVFLKLLFVSDLGIGASSFAFLRCKSRRAKCS
jgi:hypothetical protein